MLRVGIVAEGPSDWLVLEEVMRTVHPDIEFIRLRPDQTLGSRLPRGWTGVRSWCKENGPRLELLMTGVVGREIQILVIHVDCSMAQKVGAEHPCPPASDTGTALANAVGDLWLSRSSPPDFVVIATPSMSSDAWVAATFDPPHPNLADLECDKAVEDEFVRRKLLRRRDGEVKKPARIYEPLAARIAGKMNEVCVHCSQADVFRSSFRVAVARALPPSES